MSLITSKALLEVAVEEARVDGGGLFVGGGVDLGADAVEELVDLE